MILFALPALAHVPIIWLAGPSDYCEVLAGTIGNDFVMLEPGEYHGPCRFDAALSDVPVELTTVQSLDPANPAVFVGTTSDVVLELGGERVILLALTFRGLPDGVDAVRIDAPREAWLRSVTFEDVAGTALRAEGESLHVVDTGFRDVGTAMAFGCGGGCPTAADLSNNVVAGARVALEVANDGVVGARDDVYAAETGVSSKGTVALDGLLIDASTVGLSLGGPAVVTASVVRGPVAVHTEPDATGVVLVGDTFLGVLDLAGWSDDSRMTNSALDRDLPTLPPSSLANRGCPDAGTCFVDAAVLDVYPVTDGPLATGGAPDAAASADWCGFPRRDPPTIGAFEHVGPGSYGPLPLGPKRDLECGLSEPDPPTDSAPVDDHTGASPSAHSGADPVSPPVVAPPDPSGCACGAVSQPSGTASLALAAVVLLAWSGRGVARADRLGRSS